MLNLQYYSSSPPSALYPFILQYSSGITVALIASCVLLHATLAVLYIIGTLLSIFSGLHEQAFVTHPTRSPGTLFHASVMSINMLRRHFWEGAEGEMHREVDVAG